MAPRRVQFWATRFLVPEPSARVERQRKTSYVFMWFGDYSLAVAATPDYS
jgi:hypothetical protein